MQCHPASLALSSCSHQASLAGWGGRAEAGATEQATDPQLPRRVRSAGAAPPHSSGRAALANGVSHDARRARCALRHALHTNHVILTIPAS